jgi:DNA-binding response OmpR family regulator
MKEKTNILICEDDINLSSIVADYLRNNDYVVDIAKDGKEGLEKCMNSHYDICLLDIMMPNMNGFDMLQQLRANGRELPVIIISGRASKEDIINGYKLGCDDYITKPVSMDILIWKIEAILRQVKEKNENKLVHFQLGNLYFDSVKQTLGDVHLSPRENDLLLILCRKRHQLVERNRILKTLWQTDDYFASRSLSVYINHLRNHLQDCPNIKILSVHGKGYKIIDESENVEN